MNWRKDNIGTRCLKRDKEFIRKSKLEQVFDNYEEEI